MGNVGQLAIDLVISTLRMTKIGYFYTDCLVPMVGNNPYATSNENSVELSINAEGVYWTLVIFARCTQCEKVTFTCVVTLCLCEQCLNYGQ